MSIAPNILAHRDYTVMVAKTAPSVGAPLPPGYENRWNAAHGAILELARQCEAADTDGITVYVSCKNRQGFEIYKKVTGDRLSEIFSLHTPPTELDLKAGLESALADYFARKAADQTKPQGEMILVLIDGEPQQRMAIAKTIAVATQKLDQPQDLRIGFIQIGDDMIARGFLEALDENLKSSAGAKFDIVTTEVLEQVSSNCLTEFLRNLVAN